MCIIPFAFIKYGDRIRANSTFCQELREKKRVLAQEEKEREGSDVSAQEEESGSAQDEEIGGRPSLGRGDEKM